MSKKVEVRRMYVMDVEGSLSKLSNARDQLVYNELNSGFEEVENIEEFKSIVVADTHLTVIMTLNGKYKEVDKNDIEKYSF